MLIGTLRIQSSGGGSGGQSVAARQIFYIAVKISFSGGDFSWHSIVNLRDHTEQPLDSSS